MFAGGLILSITIIAFALWLHWNERANWGERDFHSKTDQAYLRARTRSRRVVHALFLVCGILIFVSTIATPERRIVWLLSWAVVTVLLLSIVMLAGIDALRTHRYHLNKLPEIRKKSLGGDE